MVCRLLVYDAEGVVEQGLACPKAYLADNDEYRAIVGNLLHIEAGTPSSADESPSPWWADLPPGGKGRSDSSSTSSPSDPQPVWPATGDRHQ
jgi:hypothetical protein